MSRQRLALYLCPLFLALTLFLVAPVHTALADGITFDDSGADLVLTNDLIEVTLTKSDGGILSIVDLANNVSLTDGSRHGCLWGAVLVDNDPSFIGGCSYSAVSEQAFSYQWHPADARLDLLYTSPDGDPLDIDATVQLVMSDDASFTLQIILTNWSDVTIERVLLPCDLLFGDNRVEAAYVPCVLPGVRLDKRFFQQDRTWTAQYPGHQAFINYMALDIDQSHLAIYAVDQPGFDPIEPVTIGLIDDDAVHPDSFYAYHSIATWLGWREQWTSRPVRFRVGEPVERTILACRQETDLADYTSLDTRLGPDMADLVRAPLIKADAHIVNKPFDQWLPDLALLPQPSLLHPVAYQPNGHDEWYPDFLPPDAQWGDTADMAQMVRAAQDAGHYVMPYINPTWWDEESPTVTGMVGATITDIAVLGRDGQIMRETYGVHEGVVVAPQTPFVQQRLADLMGQWRIDVPVDLVFEDQIGARDWRYDMNPATSVMGYAEGWINHTRAYRDQCLMTEMGWDRLAETELGFHGSLLAWQEEFDFGDDTFGAGNWSPYPLGTWLFHDLLLTYQHDLSHASMINVTRSLEQNKRVLTWCMAFGDQLSYLWTWPGTNPLHSPWLDLIGDLQQEVVAPMAGQPLDEYSQVAPSVTRSRFGEFTALANWSDAVYAVAGHGLGTHDLAGNGYMVSSKDGSVVAGVFNGRYNGHTLSAGDHFVLIERSARSIKVKQHLGSDTEIRIAPPDAWHAGPLALRAFGGDGQQIGVTEQYVQSGWVSVPYAARWQAEPVDHYAVTLPGTVYLPLCIHP